MGDGLSLFWYQLRNKDMQVIGFTNKFYTLWEVSVSDKVIGNERFTVTHYRYVKNISFDEKKVKALYPDVEVNMELRGHSSFYTTDRVYINQDKFQFGKYQGQLISECTDYDYVHWYIAQCISDENKLSCEECLLKGGYTIISCRNDHKLYLNPTQMKELEQKSQAVEEIEYSFETNGYADVTITSNAEEIDENKFACRTNVEGVRVLFDNAKEMYYNGYYYYLPVIDGKAKKLKNKVVRISPSNVETITDSTLGHKELEINVAKIELI